LDDLQLTVERLSDVWSGGTVERDLSELSSLSDLDVPLKKRVQTAEARMLTALESARAFGKSTIGLGPVTSSEDTEAVREMVRLLDNLATTYHAMAEQLMVGRSKLTRQLSKHLAWCLYRELGCLYELTFLASAAFVSWQPGLWQRIHNVFSIATENGVHKSVESGPLADHFEAENVVDLYLALVMVGLADPYQLPFRDVYRVEKFLRNHRSEIELRKSPPSEHEKLTLFSLDHKVDMPGLPFWSVTDPESLDRSFLLNTTKLVKLVRKRRHDLSRHPGRADKDFGEDSVGELKLLFKQLGARWSGRMDRRHERMKSTKSVNVLVSFEAIVKALGSGAAENDIETLFNQVESAYTGTTSARSFSPSPGDTIAASSLDKSTSGLRVRVQKSARLTARIGDVVAWNDTDATDKPWRLGTIRWIRETVPGELDLGLMRVPGSPVLGSIAMRFAKRETSFASDMPCVLAVAQVESGVRVNAIVPRMHDTDTVPSGIAVDGQQLTLTETKKILSTRLIQGFKLVIAPQNHATLVKSLDRKSTPLKANRARRGQIWSAKDN